MKRNRFPVFPALALLICAVVPSSAKEGARRAWWVDKGSMNKTFLKQKMAEKIAKDVPVGPKGYEAVRIDLNGDGVMDLKDAILSLKMLTSEDVAAELSGICDMNGDGRLGLVETIYMLHELSEAE